MVIIVGLGNPGEKYQNTRHNVGFAVLDQLATKLGVSFKLNTKFKAEIAQTGGMILVKPQTFMNNSGQAVEAVLSYYKLLPKKLGFIKEKDSDLSDILTVVHDELDVDLGKYKESVDSRSAGHNGIKSIINHLKTKNFRRIRIGIKTDEKNQIPTDRFVIARFHREEQEVIKELTNKIIDLLL